MCTWLYSLLLINDKDDIGVWHTALFKTHVYFKNRHVRNADLVRGQT